MTVMLILKQVQDDVSASHILAYFSEKRLLRQLVPLFNMGCKESAGANLCQYVIRKRFCP